MCRLLSTTIGRGEPRQFGSEPARAKALLHFILLEGAYGQTVGKMAVKIKVVQEDGTKIDYAGAAVHNILRVIDAIPFFIPYLLGAILLWTSDRKQRVGDRAARTVVVKA